MAETNESSEDEDNDMDMTSEGTGEGLRARRLNNSVSLTVSRVSSLASEPLSQGDEVLGVLQGLCYSGSESLRSLSVSTSCRF